MWLFCHACCLAFGDTGTAGAFVSCLGNTDPVGISRMIEHLQSTEIAGMLWEIAGSSFAGVIACSALLYLLV